MRAQDDLRSNTSPALSEMNDEITRITNKNKVQKWRQFLETLDHKTYPTKLWRTIKAIYGKSTPNAENEAITFDGCQVSSPKQIAHYFNRQFTTSKLGIHTTSRETRLVSREIKRKSLTSAVTFTTGQVTKGIRSCSNTRIFGPDKLSIFHLNILDPEELNTQLHFSPTPSHFVGFRRFRSHTLSSQSRNQANIPLSALLIGLSRSPVQQRLWSYGGPLTSNRQQPPASIHTPTLFPTRPLYHFCFATTDK